MMKHYQKISLRTYKFISIFLCLLGDGLAMFYIWEKFSKFERLKPLIEISLKIYNLTERNFPSNFMKDLHQLVNMTLLFSFVLIALFHSLNYFFFFLEKRPSWIYLKLLAFVGFLGCLSIGIPSIKHIGSIEFIILIQAAFYLWVGMGLLYFEEKRGTTK
jgi:hypothetical protein